MLHNICQESKLSTYLKSICRTIYYTTSATVINRWMLVEALVTEYLVLFLQIQLCSIRILIVDPSNGNVVKYCIGQQPDHYHHFNYYYSTIIVVNVIVQLVFIIYTRYMSYNNNNNMQ